MIDAHIHLDDERFDKNRQHLIAQAQRAGVAHFIVPAVQRKGIVKLKNLAIEHANIHACYGLHPYYIAAHHKQDIQALDNWLHQNKAIALGECGLDFYLKDLDKNKQLFYFEAQIALAKAHNLPLVLHARGAVDAVFNCLKKQQYFNAMIHSYNGSIHQTKKLLDLGVKFSFGGAICHANATKIHKLVKYCPADSIMFETDAPDQNPCGRRTDLNLPINLGEIINCYARICATDAKQAQKQSSLVCRDFFQI